MTILAIIAISGMRITATSDSPPESLDTRPLRRQPPQNEGLKALSWE